MDLQSIVVVLIIAAAGAYFAMQLVKKIRSFRPKSGCGDDCGCGATSEKAVP